MRRWIRAAWIRAACSSAAPGDHDRLAGFAWPDRLDGRPEQFEIGGDSAYYIWTEDDDFHLATTGPGTRGIRPIIETDGEITDVDQVRLEDGDQLCATRRRPRPGRGFRDLGSRRSSPLGCAAATI